MVLAAGFGRRMLPLTSTRPKPLVELAGRSLLDRLFDRLAAAGIARCVVNVHYLADMLEAHVRARRRPQCLVSDERAFLLDTGGGVRKALALLDRHCFLVANSDTAWIEPDETAPAEHHTVARLLAGFDPDRMDCLLLLTPRRAALGYDGQGDFDLSADGRLRARASAAVAEFVFAGVSVAHSRLLDGAPEGAFSLVASWHAAIGRGRAFGLVHQGQWLHVGDPAALAIAEAAIAAHPHGVAR